ncbi:hypothetical protein B0H34DRAFT_774932 [Crassisporium funariophilum]|nr:hypothetical protein B0H34DRAFT_774932 [Crassisporium funariophilum]
MSDHRHKTAKESKGFRNQLKNLIGLRSRSTPQSGSNSPSTVIPVPVLATDPELLARYTTFRILVIGRANAGKTTLLNRVCNTTEEPSIYDEDKNLLEPTSERGIHDVRRSFVFKSNPGFIFHDSPGFEAGGEEELKAVMTFIQKSSKAKNVDDQIHVIWFCFYPDVARPLLPLEEKFFNEGRSWNVPVVAIFMKFDDLIKQVYNRGQDKTENTKKALDTLEKKFKEPLSRYKFPPRAYVRFTGRSSDNGNHQEQVGELIKQTAASIDNLALKMLFVTVQQNNVEVCIEHAVNPRVFEATDTISYMIFQAAQWFGHCYYVGVIMKGLDNYLTSNSKGRRGGDQQIRDLIKITDIACMKPRPG